MPTPTQCVFDLTPPRRPGIDDVGGGGKLDDQQYPPDPVTMLTGADVNQEENLLVRYGAVLPMATLSVHFSGSNPSVASCTSVKTAVVPGTFTVTDLGVGITKIAWPASTFAPAVADHAAKLTGATPGSATAETGVHFVTVRCLNAAGVAADLPFNVDIWGD